MFLLATFLFTWTVNQNEVFGFPSLKIINGSSAEEGEFPYMVQLRNTLGYFQCGGSIIGPTWILTAGHCFNENTYGTVIYGTNQLYDYTNDTPPTSISVKQTYLHPKFEYNVTELGRIPVYDVGIIELEDPIPLGNQAQLLKIADANEIIPVHKKAILTGWGVNSSSEPTLAPNLQKINLELLSDFECEQQIDSYAVSSIYNYTHNICSNDFWNGGCTGDSGGPIVVNGTQFGILSWNIKPCGVVPNTYSRITNPEYRNFIKNITGI